MRPEIGSRWKRRVEPAENDGYGIVEVTGVYEQQEISEVCVRAVGGFGPTLSVTPADLEAAFTLEQAAPAVATPDIADVGGAWL
jgi:hypothetical protein